MDKISVLMSTYNESLDWIDKSIKSILDQTYTNFEFIIVCDNPQNDDLQTYLKEYEKKDKRIKLLINDTNIGLASSLNKAFEYSKGEFIARMDADDISYPNRFMNQIRFIKDNKDIDLLCGNVDIINETGKVTKRSKHIEYNDEQLRELLEIGNVLMHPTFFMKRNSFEKIGGYRSFPAAEDYDFILRALSQNLKLYQFNETVLKYRMRENSMTFGNALISQLCTTYIQELYKERKHEGKDSFSIEKLNEIKEVDPIERRKFSDILFKISVLNKDSTIKRIYTSLKGLLISKYFRKYFLSMLNVSYQIRKYE